MRRADVCLVLEGTYPFVSGGVSSWVHHLTSQLPHLTFYVLHISPKRGFYPKGAVYEMPKNILGVQEVFLHDYVVSAKGRPTDLREKVLRFRGLVHDMQQGRSGSFAAFLEALQQDGNEGFSSFDLLQTHESWQVLVESYRAEASDESFLNFFWTWRYAYLPLFNLLSTKIPRARVYHTISTGYAGMLAAGAKIKTGAPMLLTEHGIYTKERRIEINRSDWIQDWDSGELVAERRAPYFRRYWIRQFEMMSTVTYDYANEIFTLYTGNTLDQISDGADPGRIRVIANGIDLDRFGEAAARFDAREPNKRFTVCFVGRVCPIKDVMTFISAMRLVADEVPDVRIRVLGPMEEDAEYAEMCQRHARQLHLEKNIAFEGRVNVLEEMPKVDVVVLTSISEAQPLVILEAGAVGLPCIATNVGSCDELLFGRTPEDRTLGAGGIITPMASPGATARAVLDLYHSESMRERMRDTMRERVRRFYDQRDMVAAYDEIYQRHARTSPVEEDPNYIEEAPVAESEATRIVFGQAATPEENAAQIVLVEEEAHPMPFAVEPIDTIAGEDLLDEATPPEIPEEDIATDVEPELEPEPDPEPELESDPEPEPMPEPMPEPDVVRADETIAEMSLDAAVAMPTDTSPFGVAPVEPEDDATRELEPEPDVVRADETIADLSLDAAVMMPADEPLLVVEAARLTEAVAAADDVAAADEPEPEPAPEPEEVDEETAEPETVAESNVKRRPRDMRDVTRTEDDF
ncbi:MAG: GT4 family glycosyltransferase PelF [Planctomycetota bacterium]|nr:GT4 family glycosyltransferase PelF [Planctomycetota bacterium]